MKHFLRVAMLVAFMACSGITAVFADKPQCVARCGQELAGCEAGVQQRIDNCTEVAERACDYLPAKKEECKREARTICEAKHSSDHDTCLSTHKSCVAGC